MRDSGLQLHVYIHASTYVTMCAFVCMCKSSHITFPCDCLMSELFSFESREIEKDSLRRAPAWAQDPGAF